MRELNISEMDKIAGAGYIRNEIKYFGYRFDKSHGGDGKLGEKIGDRVGTFMEKIPGASIINAIMDWTYPCR